MPAFCSTRRKQVQNGAVGDAEESDRADEGGEAGDGKPAVAAEIELPRPLPLNSQPPGNKRSPIFMISCVSARHAWRLALPFPHVGWSILEGPLQRPGSIEL